MIWSSVVFSKVRSKQEQYVPIFLRSYIDKGCITIPILLYISYCGICAGARKNSSALRLSKQKVFRTAPVSQ